MSSSKMCLAFTESTQNKFFILLDMHGDAQGVRVGSFDPFW